MARKSTNGKKKGNKKITIEKDANKLKINTSTILGVMWAGLFGYQAFASYMMPEQLFFLVALGLIVGTVLTIAILMYGLKIAEIWAKTSRAKPQTPHTSVNSNSVQVMADMEMPPLKEIPLP